MCERKIVSVNAIITCKELFSEKLWHNGQKKEKKKKKKEEFSVQVNCISQLQPAK